MTSLNEQVNQLHEAFCRVTGRTKPLNQAWERWWYDALSFEVTPEMVIEVMQARMKRQYANADQRFYCLSLPHLIGDSDRLGAFVDEAAQIESMKRKRVFTPGKAQALQDTGRPGEPEAQKVRHVSEVFEGMRKAT